jgi:glycosyltransferase involved in cell wall biosynthesis
MDLISIILSFRNEEANIPELARRIAAVFVAPDLDYEMIFINDCSTDRSLSILTALAAKDERIKIINTSRRCGPSACVLAGLAHARGAAAICIDSDLQDPPELITKMVEEWRKGADVVNTTRLSRAGESRVKMQITRWAYYIINFVSDTDIPMDTGDYKLLSRRVMLELLRLREYDPFLRGLVRWVGFCQTQIFYHREPRAGGRTNMPIWGRGPVRAFISGVTSFSSYPLYVSMIFGTLISALAFLYLLGIVITKEVWNMHNPGWPSIMATILFLSGLLLMSNGINGVYIGRIHRQVKQRPLWIIESTVNIGSEISELNNPDYLRGFEDARSLAARKLETLVGNPQINPASFGDVIRSITPDDKDPSRRELLSGVPS